MKFRKKPVVIEAVRYYGDNYKEICSFVGKELDINWKTPTYSEITIPTLEGNMLASKGDWIIKGIKGEFYPCKPDIFEKTYEKVEEQ